MPDDPSQHYLENIILEFGLLKKQAERAIAQLDDQELFVSIDAESNSVATIVKHLAGNMRSRWVDFLTSDGEKADRFRDQEFELDAAVTREVVMQWWETGWGHLFHALGNLSPDDVLRKVIIRQEPHTVLQAINRQLTHYATHIGQIVFLTKHLKSSTWKTLSVPRGQSEQFNRRMIEKSKKERENQTPVPRY
jgi:Protein of unknown function (DUF1572)